MSPKEDRARKRALIIMQVRSGRITATEGARRLGISRKTYYEWEKRGLEGLMKALEDQDSGRPALSVDTGKETMSKHIRELERELLIANQRVAVKKAQLDYEQKQRALDRERRREKRAKKKRT